jgi:hypothetical protein
LQGLSITGPTGAQGIQGNIGPTGSNGLSITGPTGSSGSLSGLTAGYYIKASSASTIVNASVFRESIAGTVIAAGNIVPDVTLTYNIGTTTSYWANQYSGSLNISNSIINSGTTQLTTTSINAFRIQNSSGTINYFTVDTSTPQIILGANMFPTTGGGSSIGSATLYYQNIYSNYMWCSTSGLSSYGAYVALGWNNGGTSQDTVFFGNCRPANDNSVSLGNSTHHWTAVYAINGTIQTSDENQKQNITILEDSMGLPFINKLQPKKWNWCDGNTEDVQYGLVYQDIDALDNDNNFGFLYPSQTGTDNNNNIIEGVNGLNYSGLIGPIILAVQQLTKQVTELQATVLNQSSTISLLQNQISLLQSNN